MEDVAIQSSITLNALAFLVVSRGHCSRAVACDSYPASADGPHRGPWESPGCRNERWEPSYRQMLFNGPQLLTDMDTIGR